MKEAINKEINQKYIEAVENYENEIGKKSLEVVPDSFINLAFLYWCFAFELFEFVIPNDVSEYWSNVGGSRFPKILKLGLSKYPNNRELHFWEKYFLHISFGEKFSKKDCLKLIKTYFDEQSLVPYFFYINLKRKNIKKNEMSY